MQNKKNVAIYRKYFYIIVSEIYKEETIKPSN